jgi:hypothetical protein
VAHPHLQSAGVVATTKHVAGLQERPEHGGVRSPVTINRHVTMAQRDRGLVVRRVPVQGAFVVAVPVITREVLMVPSL